MIYCRSTKMHATASTVLAALLLLTFSGCPAGSGVVDSENPPRPETDSPDPPGPGTNPRMDPPSDGDGKRAAQAGTAVREAIAAGPVEFDEPAGIALAHGVLYVADTNNHAIRTIDLRNNYRTGTLQIEGLKPPAVPPEPELAAADGQDTEERERKEKGGEDAAVEDAKPSDDVADDGAREMPEVPDPDPRKAPPRPPVPPRPDDLALADPDHPFPNAIELPFDFPEGLEWINTSEPLRLEDLRGKFVILDFWTYCCINCIHVLPELKKLERAFPKQLVVIGVHCAKFETEKGVQNIEEAVLRYEIEHPVVNDPDHRIWTMFGARSWPTIALIDPEGKFLGKVSGEIQAEPFKDLLVKSIPFYRERGLLDERAMKFDLAKYKQKPTPLKFPGKVLADAASGRLFIADSNNNRVVISSLDGKLIEVIGTGAIGQTNGGYDEATFNKPQGMALRDETLYVADTENHLIRKIDLATKIVTTIAGTGVQGRNAWPGMDEFHPFAAPPERFVADPKEFAINSPWALYLHGDDLYIAMAGPHQIWKMTLDEKEIGPYAGNGREDIVDGPLLPETPYELGYSSFAQPSGLTSDGKWLYVADSEGSSIRAVPFDPEGEVQTVVGTNHLEGGRLFEFGHRDGQGEQVLLQHALGVVYDDGRIYVADTYNNAIKEIDVAERTCRTIAGDPPVAQADPETPGEADQPALESPATDDDPQTPGEVPDADAAGAGD